VADAPAPSDIPEAAGSPGTPVARTPRRRRWLRRLVTTFVVLVVLVILAPLAVRLPFVRSWVADRASQTLGLPVTIAGTSAWWTSGIDLTGVVVGSPPGYDGPLATIPRVHVDVALGRLLKGDVEATVEVTQPNVALRRKADGRWNFREQRERRAGHVVQDEAPDAAPAQQAGGGPILHLTVTDGVLETHALGLRVERVSKITFRAELSADGALEGTLAAMAEQAGVRGEDVAITFSGGLAPDGETPIEATVPDLDLARLSALTEGLTGWQGVRGTARIDVRGVVTAQGGVRGRLTLEARGIEAKTADGARVAVGTASGKMDVTQQPNGDAAELTLALEGVEVVDGAGADARTLSEPSVNVIVTAELGRDESVHVSKLEVTAGKSLRVRGVGPLEISAPGPAGRRLAGKAEVAADLAKLSALKTFVPSLAPLRSGVLSASLEGRAEEGLDVGLGARVTNLALAPGDLALEGYAERDVTLQGRFSRSKDGEMRVLIYDVRSALARLSGTKPFEARIAPGGAVSFAGPLDLAVDLDALSRAFGGALGLAHGERLRGTFGARGTTSGTSEDGRLEATLAGRGVEVPASWGPSRVPGTLDGTVTLTWTRTALLGEVKDLRGLGLEASATAALKRDATSTAFDGADLRLVADLAQVRALFGAKLGLAAGTTLAGRLHTTLRVSSAPAGRRIDGTTQVAALAYRAAPDGALLDEPALTLEHVLVVPRETGPLTLETARVRGNGYAADLSGSSFGPGADGRVDLRGTLEGEAARLAERVRAFLPRDYHDLTGSGRVTGRIAFAGGPSPSLLAGGTADADLTLGTWSAAGATLAEARLTVGRPKAGVPYQVALTGTLNQGTAAIGLAATPAGDALGWRLVAGLKGVDLSTVLLDHGAGKYLGYVLPTIVPTDKSTPVLSGRLDADVDLAATDVSGDALRKTLAGRGNLALTQGTLAESTLFAAIGGGNGLGEVGKTLRQVAPEVGQALAGFQRAVTFESLMSRFEVGGERIDVKEARLAGHAVRIDMAGIVDFEQRIDLATLLWIGSKAGERLKTVVPDQTLPLRVKNTLQDPRIIPDVKMGNLLKGALERLLQQGGEGLGDVGKRLEEEAKKLKERLPGLFGK
jgi:hypothetical protein